MNKKYSVILMDLDGTVTDPIEGITKSVQYALSGFGIHIDNTADLCRFIGPPLKDSFMEFYGFTDREADEAIRKYRERFSVTGIFENELYDGMIPFLARMKEQGKTIMLATSKPHVYARQIIDYFGLSSYFSFIGGSNLDGTRSRKDEVIRYVLQQNDLTDVSDIVMVGDRKHDITGANLTGLDSVGVLYGYGDRSELETAGATYIVESVAALSALLLSE